MGINVSYDPANFVKATGVPRQWRIKFLLEKDGIVTSHDVLFPDGLTQLVSQGYITPDEMLDKLYEIVMWAVRKRTGA